MTHNNKHSMWLKALTLVPRLALAAKSFAWQRFDFLRQQLPAVSATTPPHALPHPSSTKSRLGNNNIVVNAGHENVAAQSHIRLVSKSNVSLYNPGDKIQVKIMSFGRLVVRAPMSM
jgi:hypothetical protein